MTRKNQPIEEDSSYGISNGKSIFFIGAGNVATHLSHALLHAGYKIKGVYSRTTSSAQTLGDDLGCFWTTNIEELLEADIYIFSIKDSVLEELLSKVILLYPQAIFVHTAGSIPLSIFHGKVNKYGIFYPMQTFSKKRAVLFDNIPIFVEPSDNEVAQTLFSMAQSISSQVNFLDSDRRLRLHLASVLACNFANHCYTLASQEMEKAGLPFEYLLPLIDETAKKVHELPPEEAQTGPAVRYDENVINKHLSLISETIKRDIYKLMSLSIHQNSHD